MVNKMGRTSNIKINTNNGYLKIIDVLPSNKTGTHAKAVCICICGKNAVVSSHLLWKIQSCGCMQYKPKPRIPKLLDDTAAFNSLYYQYQRSALKRNLKFDISKEQFKSIVQNNCYYCKSEPTNVFKSGRSKFICNGIDRIDSIDGYNLYNVLPCCKICNFAKRDLIFENFINWLVKIKLRGANGK